MGDSLAAWHARDVDQAAGEVGVTGFKPGEPGFGGRYIQQTASDAPVQRANRGLVLADGVAIGAVAQPEREAPTLCRFELRLESERAQRRLQRVLGARVVGRGKLHSDLTASGFDPAKTARSDRTREPSSEVRVGSGGASTG
jgi:hypothetical protein